jgi:hypothetical protein
MKKYSISPGGLYGSRWSIKCQLNELVITDLVWGFQDQSSECVGYSLIRLFCGN